MGFLRKLGKKIKKGVKKLFSSKLGSLIGSIGLSMIMGPVISRAFNGIKGVFTGTGATAGQAASQAAAQQATAEAAKQKLAQQGLKESITSSLTADAGTKLTTEQLLAGETSASLASKQVAGKALTEEGIKTAFTNSAAASRKAMEAAIQAGNPVDFTNVLTQGTASGTIPLNISNTVTGSLNNIDNYIKTGDMFTPEVSKSIKVNQDLIKAKEAVESAKTTKLFGDKKLGADIKENFTDFGKDVRDFVKDPVGKTKEFVGDDFIPDVARSVGTSYVMGAIQGEPEEQFYSKGVQQVGSFEPAQSSYMAEVRTQIPTLQATNFQQLNQSLLYGTLSPQYLIGQTQYS